MRFGRDATSSWTAARDTFLTIPIKVLSHLANPSKVAICFRKSSYDCKSQPIAQDVELLQRVEIGKSSQLTITSLREWFIEDDENFCPAKYPQ